NSQYAGKEGGGYMEPERNGYIDLSYIDYERLPKNTGIVGIVRGGDPPNNTLMLLAPPFALRFNRRGNLIVGVSQDLPDAHRLVFYDADYNGKYRSSGIGSSRSSPYGGITPYNPDLWDPRSHGYL